MRTRRATIPSEDTYDGPDAEYYDLPTNSIASKYVLDDYGYPVEDEDVYRDAMRWRALTRGVNDSGDIAAVTTLHQPHSNPVPGSRFLVLHLWSERDPPISRRLSAHCLFDYADSIIERNNT